MNWEAIKYIYYHVLVRRGKIKYLGGDKYILTFYDSTGDKRWEAKYKNGKLHGKYIGWYKNKQKTWEREFKNGKMV